MFGSSPMRWRSWGLATVILLLVAAACGDTAADTTTTAVAIPAGATFCSVYNGEYQAALDGAVPATDDGFDDAAAEIVAWALVLEQLAPAEIASLAADNVGYHEAQAAIQSASDFIPGSNEMHDWARTNC